MNPFSKVNILVSGTDCQECMSAIIEENTFVYDLPPIGHFRILPSKDTFEKIESDPVNNGLVRRIVETPVANFIEANALVPVFGKKAGRQCCGEMSDYVKEIEAELRSSGFFPGGAAKIDVIWYCLDDKIDFPDEDEQDFIRSVAAVPRVIIVADPGFSSRSVFKETMDYLSGLAGNRLILNCVVVQPDALVLSGAMKLLECTKNMYLGKFGLSEDERAAYESAWSEYYGEQYDEWREDHECDLSHVLQCAAERAQAILKRNEPTELDNTIGECVSIATSIINAVKGGADPEIMRKKSHLGADKWVHQRISELKFNIVCEVYEVAACFGRVVPRYVVRELLRLIPGDFPLSDAVAVTYAIGRVAEVLAGDYFWYAKNVKTIFDEAKEEALQMDFDPFDDSMIQHGEDEDFEPGYGDCESSGEADAVPVLGRGPGEEAPEAFFEHVTKSIKSHWKEEKSAGTSRDPTNSDVIADMPGNSALPPVVDRADSAHDVPADRAIPEIRPKKPGKTTKAARSGTNAKNTKVKKTGKKHKQQKGQ